MAIACSRTYGLHAHSYVHHERTRVEDAEGNDVEIGGVCAERLLVSLRHTMSWVAKGAAAKRLSG